MSLISIGEWLANVVFIGQYFSKHIISVSKILPIVF